LEDEANAANVDAETPKKIWETWVRFLF
jgi:hypothetical protein